MLLLEDHRPFDTYEITLGIEPIRSHFQIVHKELIGARDRQKAFETAAFTCFDIAMANGIDLRMLRIIDIKKLTGDKNV
jgi:hypothetical protein